ncbi:MjaI family restriction endonuclease, partial [Fischerella thermalis]
MAGKEWILNQAFNRWQFNRPKYVGKLSEAIRACAPSSIEEWVQYYQEHVRPSGEMLGTSMQEHLEEIGRRLYIKISEQLHAEIRSITEDDCIAYVRDVVIRRTYEGYVTEKETVYEQLEEQLGVDLKPAPDEWDRKYNVDFYIEVGKRFIGIQIKPTTYKQTPEPFKWQKWLQDAHREFESQFGGKVFDCVFCN